MKRSLLAILMLLFFCLLFDNEEAKAEMQVATAIAAGKYHTCAIISNKVYCWGNNNSGQLGIGGDICGSECNYLSPQLIADPDSGKQTGLIISHNVIKISAGDNHSCAIPNEDSYSGHAYCWGKNDEGQLGTGGSATATPRSVSTSAYFSDIKLSGNNSCGLYSTDSRISCWGLGNSYPQEMNTLSNVSQFAVGYHHICAINNGKVYCWGQELNTGWGQLGDNNYRSTLGVDKSTPLEIWDTASNSNTGLLAGKAPYKLWAGGYNTFVSIAAGDLYGFGLMDNCQMEFAPSCGGGSSHTNKAISSGDSYGDPFSVGFKHSCGTRAGVGFYCWGYNNKGQLGTGSINSSDPHYVNGGTKIDSSYFGGNDVTAASAGYEHTCAIAGGKIYCWGDNTYGQLGDGTTELRSRPTLINFDFGDTAEVCGDGIDNDDDSEIDEDCSCTGSTEGYSTIGSACSDGVGVCSVDGYYGCSDGVVACSAIEDLTQSKAEVCNNKDDDCNGSIDDGIASAACNTGNLGVCAAGTTSCVAGETVCIQTVASSIEVCDGLDNDCDGSVDESFPEQGESCIVPAQFGVCSIGTKICSLGIICMQTTSASPEVCGDGLDNDCDGVVDNGCGCEADPNFAHIGEDCNTGLSGICAVGKYQCNGSAVICAQTVSPTTEICDGVDNDCDGQTDESFPGKGENCDTGVPGICAAGTRVCILGTVVCNQNTPAIGEICGDGLDNDCDGVVDDGCAACEGDPNYALIGKDCNTGNDGICAVGKYQCNGTAVVCAQTVLPETEICDGLDNDCDGKIDEDFSNKDEVCFIGEGVCKGTGNFVCSEDKLSTVCNAKLSRPECWNVTPEDLSEDDDKDGITNPYDSDIKNPPVVNNIQKPLKPLVIASGKNYKLYFQWFADFISKIEKLVGEFSLKASKNNNNVKKNVGVGVNTKVVEDNHIGTKAKADRQLAQCQKTCQRTGCKCKKLRDKKRLSVTVQSAAGFIVRKTITKTITNKKIQNLKKKGKVPNEFKVKVRKNCTYKASYRVIYINKKGRIKKLSPFSEVAEF